jgi:hypothetical protein
MWAGACAAEGAETPWTEVQVGLAISGKMACLSFIGGPKVTNAIVAFSGEPWTPH